MKTFDEWLKKYDELAQKWEKTGLLKLIPEEYRFDCARCLEGQRIYNEQLHDLENIAQFKRVSIPIMRRLFAGAIEPWRNLKIEGSAMPCEKWHTFENIEFPKYEDYCSNRNAYHNLDNEAKAVADISAKLTEAIQNFAAGRKLKLHCISFDQNNNLMINYD